MELLGETPNGLSASKILKEFHLLAYRTLVYQASSYTPVPLSPEVRVCEIVRYGFLLFGDWRERGFATAP